MDVHWTYTKIFKRDDLMKTVLELEKVSKIYNGGESKVYALDSVSLGIKEGNFIGIVGQSGSGKSTLMHIIGLLDNATEGKVYVNGIDTTSLDENERALVRGKHIGFVFQAFNLIPSLTALENVELPMVIYEKSQEERKRKASDILTKLGMQNRLNHYPNQLSGGQKQRVAIARALANDPAIILADEPTGNLDSKTGQDALALLSQLNKEGRTIVIVTHDSNIVKTAKIIVNIKDGKIVSGGNLI